MKKLSIIIVLLSVFFLLWSCGFSNMQSSSIFEEPSEVEALEKEDKKVLSDIEKLEEEYRRAKRNNDSEDHLKEIEEQLTELKAKHQDIQDKIAAIGENAFCQRTEPVVRAIIVAVERSLGITGSEHLSCLQITENHLRALNYPLDLRGAKLYSASRGGDELTTGDFDDLRKVPAIDFRNSGLLKLPSKIFDDLVGLKALMFDERYITIPSGTFTPVMNNEITDMNGSPPSPITSVMDSNGGYDITKKGINILQQQVKDFLNSIGTVSLIQDEDETTKDEYTTVLKKRRIGRQNVKVTVAKTTNDFDVWECSDLVIVSEDVALFASTYNSEKNLKKYFLYSHFESVFKDQVHYEQIKTAYNNIKTSYKTDTEKEVKQCAKAGFCSGSGASCSSQTSESNCKGVTNCSWTPKDIQYQKCSEDCSADYTEEVSDKITISGSEKKCNDTGVEVEHKGRPACTGSLSSVTFR